MFRSAKLLIMLAIVAGITLAILPSVATTWDLANGFSTVANPAAPWSFGTEASANLGTSNWGLSSIYYTTLSPLVFWTNNGAPGQGGSCNGAVGKNFGAAAEFTYNHGDVYAESGQVIVTATPISGGSYTGQTKVRWTAPSSYAALRVYGMFTAQDGPNNRPSGTNADVSVDYRGGAAVMGHLSGFYGTLANGYADRTGASPIKTFDTVIYNVSAGETIEFHVTSNDTSNDSNVGLAATIDTTLPTAGTVSGRVLASGGTGLDGVTVKVVGVSSGSYNKAVTAGGGYYSIPVPADSYTVKAHKLGYEKVAASSPVAVTAGGTSSVADITLRQNYWYTFSDEDFGTTNPNGPWAFGHKWATSDPDNQYVTDTFNNVWGPMYDANDGQGVFPMMKWVSGQSGIGIYHNVTPYAEKAYASCCYYGLAIEPEASGATGGSTYPHGFQFKSPLTGNIQVSVKFSYIGAAAIYRSTPTVYVMRGTTMLASSTLNGFVGSSTNGYSDSFGPAASFAWSGTLTNVSVGEGIYFLQTSGGSVNIDAQINPVLTPGTVSGVVTANLGMSHPPVAGALVANVGGSESSTTDSAGHYSLTLGAGSYNLRASKAAYESLTVNNVAVTSGNTTTQNFDLTTSFIKGKVMTIVSGNAAIAGASVTTSDGLASALTDSAGNYSLQVSQGTYTLNVYKSSYFRSQTSVQVGVGATATHDFYLDPGWDFAADFTTANAPTAGSGPWSYMYSNSTAVGLMNMTGDFHTGNIGSNDMCWWGTSIDPNDYDVAALLKNLLSTPVGVGTYREPGKVIGRTGSLAGKQTIARFTAPSAGRFTVAARWAGTNSIAGSSNAVSLLYNGTYLFGDPSSQATAQQINGFAGTAANSYADSFGTAPVITYSQDIDLGVGETVDSVLMLPDTGWTQMDMTVMPAAGVGHLSGHVTAGNIAGSPGIPNATVNLTPGGLSTTTDAYGAYDIAVAAGDYYAECGASGYNTPGYNVTVTSGNTTTQNFSLTHAGTWSLMDDYTVVANPNGQWSYGQLSSTVMTPYPTVLPFASYVGVAPNVPVWRNNTADSQSDKHAGWFGKNTVASVKWGGNTGLDINKSTLGGSGGPAGIPGVRWTSPDTRIVNIHLDIENQSGGTLPVSLKKNGTMMVTKSVTGGVAFAGTSANGYTDSWGSYGPSPKATFETQLVVNAGDTIDMVLCSANGNGWALDAPGSLGVSMIVSPGDGVACASITDLKSKAVGKTVFLTTPLVLAAASDRYLDYSFYIENDDRSQGMKCIGTSELPTFTQGTKLTFTGTIANDPNGSGQKVVMVQSINSTATGTAPTPVGTGSKSWSSTTKPLNMLVRIWGKLVAKNPSDIGVAPYPTQWPWNYWIINDGGQDVKVIMTGQTGWMVPPYIPDWPIGSYISVSGIATLDSSGSVVLMPWNEGNFDNYSGS